MAGDLRSLGASYPALAQAVQKLQGGLDLLQAHRQVSAGGGLGAPCSAELPTRQRPGNCLTEDLSPSWPQPQSLATGHQGPRHRVPQERVSPHIPTLPRASLALRLPPGFSALPWGLRLWAPELTSERVTPALRP